MVYNSISLPKVYPLHLHVLERWNSSLKSGVHQWPFFLEKYIYRLLLDTVLTVILA